MCVCYCPVVNRLTIVTVLLTAVLACSCNRTPGDASAAKTGGFSVPVETVAAHTERVEDKIAAVGSLEPNEMVQVKSEIAGRIAKVSFDEGAAVGKGDILFELDDAKWRAALESAEARLEKARNNLGRSRKLMEENTISQQELDDAQVEFKDASALVVLARERLADATIRSPLDGKISARLVSPGQYVEEAQTLVTVVDSDPMKIEFAVPERFLHQLRLGQKVNVKVAGIAGKTFTGEVYFIDPRIEPSTRTVKLKALVPNPDGELRPGLFANVELITGTRENAVVVPEQAVVPAIDKLTVFIVEDGVAKRRQVTVGARLPGKVEIVEGITAGEEIVIAGQQKLRDQIPVKPMERPPAT